MDQRTFSASLLAPLDMGTSYVAEIKDDLKNLKGKSIGAGGKGLQREGAAKREQPEDVERDVDQEIQKPERNVARVVPEESQPRRAAGEQAGMAEEHDGEGEEQGAGNERLDVFEQAVVGSGSHG